MTLEQLLGPQDSDLEVVAGADLSAYQYCAVEITTGQRAGTLGSSSPLIVVAGILQNAPLEGQTARIRSRGWSYVLLNDTISKGDYIWGDNNAGGGDEGKLRKWNQGTHGHKHDSETAETGIAIGAYASFYVENGGAAVTGKVTADFTLSAEYQHTDESFSASGDTPYVVEVGSGWYTVALAAPLTHPTARHLFKVAPNGFAGTILQFHGLTTPGPTGVNSPVRADSTMPVLGQMLEDGSAGEAKIAMLTRTML